MRINLGQDKSDTINNTHACFEGTDLEGYAFEIDIQRIDDGELQDIQERFSTVKDKRIAIDFFNAQIETFVHIVKGWRNINGVDGVPIPCTDENKRAIARRIRDLREGVIVAARRPEVLDDIQEVEEKN